MHFDGELYTIHIDTDLISLVTQCSRIEKPGNIMIFVV